MNHNALNRVALVLALSLTLSIASSAQQTTRPLEIYWIDVEGGAATLIVSPSGESLLIDTGWEKDGRDARRIHDVATRVAGLTRIDQLIMTHYHEDHAGGVGELSRLMPIGRCLDHGDNSETRELTVGAWNVYEKACAGKRAQPAPGSRIPMTGVDITVASANGVLVSQPINGGGARTDAAVCANPVLKRPDNGENGRSVGVLLRYGRFTFLDLGDLTWNKEIDLACPTNRFGKIDLFQVSHHGMDMSGAPPFVNSVGARVAVMNNGPRKGGIGSTLDTVRHAPGLEDLWQLHVSFMAERAQNVSDTLIANLGEEDGCPGHYIKASVDANGRYTVTNSRTGFSKTYDAK
jgi:beta-lactamase superfamily II metal-dependent hydrolase